jgi:trehalose 6-phosphate phosphatase
MNELARELGQKVAAGGRLWLFLDYDGTLADFAPTPDEIYPDPELIAIIRRLTRVPDCLRVVILSGRRLSHILKLLPVDGILLAGTYGVEFQTWEGERITLLNFETERPFLDQVKTQWAGLIKGRNGFYLEDKVYSLALHAKNASDKEAREVIQDATRAARDTVERGSFRVVGGKKFLEVAPTIADKGQSVSMLLKRFPWPNADIIYFGDDDKDEEGFKVIVKDGGTAVLVAREERPSAAQYRLETPAQVRAWLRTLGENLPA